MLLLGDIALLYGALFLTLIIRYGSFPTQVLWQDHNLPFLFVNLVWLIIFYIAGLYDVEKIGSSGQDFLYSQNNGYRRRNRRPDVLLHPRIRNYPKNKPFY